MKSNLEKEYISRYKTLGNIIANTFKQMESSANTINENAARILYEMEKNSGLPSDRDLDRLAASLGVKAFYVTNKSGRFIRSTDVPLNIQTNSLFKYCNDYKLLVKGNVHLYRTPIIPGYPYNIPMKYTMIPNHNKTLILESGVELEYIGNILNQAIKNDSNIISIGFYTQTGFELGYITEFGKYHRGMQNNSLNFDERKMQNIIFTNRSMTFNVKIPSIDAYCCECIYKNVSNSTGNYFYMLRLNVSLDPLDKSIYELRKKGFIILILACIFSIVVSRILANKLVRRIQKINKTASDIIKSNDLNLRVNIDNKSDEISDLAKTFNEMIDGLKIGQVNLVESEKKAALFDLAASVAHDIRSPLAALNMLTSHDLPIPDESRVLLRNVINRIRDIANALIDKYRNQNEIVDSIGDCSAQLLTAILYPIITEKRLQLRSNSYVSLEFETNFDSYGLFAKVNSTEFKRMLSNLINNAIEAISDNGKIVIRISRECENIYLTVADNGKGIPHHILNDLGKLGVSYDKKLGSGIGLHHAKVTMEKLGGSLQLRSEVGKGTQVILTFPEADTPMWFLPKLEIQFDTILVIVDDDISIHQLWQERFKQINHPIKIIAFTSPEKFKNWMSTHEYINPILYLFDFEYVGYDQTGLELINLYQLQANSVLMTSHFEEKEVCDQCEKLKVKMIPKDLVVYVPIILNF